MPMATNFWYGSCLFKRESTTVTVTMIVRIFLGVTGCLCMALGFIGLAVPLMPGFVFFAIGAMCLASASPFLAHQLAKQPKLGRFLARLESSRELTLQARLKVALWATAEIFVDKKRT